VLFKDLVPFFAEPTFVITPILSILVDRYIGNKPDVVYTDALRAYREGVKTLGNVEHIAKCGINKPHANNNRVERLNGTLRERVKVQRGWKSHKSAIAEGQRIYYNFVKPHQALKGKTPAEKAGIETKGRDKWKNLFSKST
jgi:putative transposase